MGTRKIFSPEEAKKRFESLPQDIKDAIYGTDMSASITKIGEKNKLHLDQLIGLEGEISFVMLGFTEPTDFSKELAERLNIDRVKAAAIAEDADSLIFDRIRESLKRLHGVEGETKAATPPSPAPSAVPSVTTPFTSKPTQSGTSIPRPSISSSIPVPQRVSTPQEPTISTLPTMSFEQKSAPQRPSPDAAFETRTVKREEVVDVGIAPAKKEYRGKTDPYREPIE